jgi:hypothetical protein
LLKRSSNLSRTCGQKTDLKLPDPPTGTLVISDMAGLHRHEVGPVEKQIPAEV